MGTLTPNAIVALNSGEADLHPVVQVLDLRQIGTGQSVQERYRLVLSDGNYVQQAMLATQLNELIKSGQVQKGSIIKLVEYICNTIQQRKIIIVLNMEVVASISEIIGDPKQVIMNDQASNSTHMTGGLQQHQWPSMAGGQGAGNQQMNGIHAKEGAVLLHALPASKSGEPVSYQGQGVIFPGGNPHVAGRPGMHSNLQANTHGRPLGAPPSYQPTPIYSNRGPITKNEAPARFVPIAALNPYQGRWTIKARVTSKGDIRRFHNAKGEGKVFSFDLLDAEGGEIRVTCFNNVADQFHECIEVGSVYMISKGSLKPVQRSFNHLKNDWEIFLENTSTVEKCFDEDGSIPHQQFNFRPINEVENVEGNAMVDVIGVVVKINPTTTIMRKTGTEVQKRTLHLRDSSGCSVEFTLWGGFCNIEGQKLQEMCDCGHFPILAVKGGRVSDFGGKSIGTVSSSQLFINPDLPQALEIKSWFEQGGNNTAAQPISKEGANGSCVDMRKTVSQIKDEGLGRSEKPDWIALKATISFIKSDNFCYTACPLPVGDRQCNKKVISIGDGIWRCDRCDKSVTECDYRYLLSVQVQDHTGVTWITAFQDAGEEIIGVSAKDLYTWKEEESPKFRDTVQKLLFTQYLFKLKVKEENYNDEMRVKCMVVKSEKLDYAAENNNLIGSIWKLSRGEPINGPTSTLPGPSVSCYPNGYPLGASGQFGSSRGGSIGGNTSFVQKGFGRGYANGASTDYENGSCGKCGEAHFGKDCRMNQVMDIDGGGLNGSLGYVNRGFNESLGHANGGFDGSVGHANGGFNGSVRYTNGGVNGSVGNANACFKCGQGGHWARDCPAQGASGSFGRESSYGGYGRGF